MKTYRTKDLERAAYLKARDIELLKVEKKNTRILIFVFKDEDEKVEQLLMEYINETDGTPARRLFATWKALKSIVYDVDLSSEQ